MKKKDIIDCIMTAIRYLRDQDPAAVSELRATPADVVLVKHGQCAYCSMSLLERSLGYKNKETLTNIMNDLVALIYA